MNVIKTKDPQFLLSKCYVKAKTTMGSALFIHHADVIGWIYSDRILRSLNNYWIH